MADSGNSEQPIIVKKVKKKNGHHGGAWKVAYADFVTAMMALFIVLWILSAGEEVQQAVAGYFKDPIGFQSGGGKVVDPSSKLNLMDQSIFDEKEFKETQRERLEKMKEEIMNKLSENEGISLLSDQVKFEMTDEGLRIEMIESSDDVFFKLSSSRLNPIAKTILENIAQEINQLPNKVVVEGHTDVRPFGNNTSEYTNYELSTDRANSARRALVEGGLSREKIDEIRGYAANRLRDEEDPYSLVNRRISIIIKYEEKP